MWEKGGVSRWVGRQGGNFSFENFVEDEPLGPVVVGDLVRGMDPGRPEPLDHSRVPDSDHKQVGK